MCRHCQCAQPKWQRATHAHGPPGTQLPHLHNTWQRSHQHQRSRPLYALHQRPRSSRPQVLHQPAQAPHVPVLVVRVVGDMAGGGSAVGGGQGGRRVAAGGWVQGKGGCEGDYQDGKALSRSSGLGGQHIHRQADRQAGRRVDRCCRAMWDLHCAPCTHVCELNSVRPLTCRYALRGWVPATSAHTRMPNLRPPASSRGLLMYCWAKYHLGTVRDTWCGAWHMAHVTGATAMGHGRQCWVHGAGWCAGHAGWWHQPQMTSAAKPRNTVMCWQLCLAHPCL